MALIYTDYGKDIVIGKVVGTRSGLSNLLYALVRRLSTARGSLFYDLEYGLDLRTYINGEIDNNILDEIRVNIEQELEKDERVQSARCSLEFNESAFTLKVTIQVTPYSGRTFILILSVDKLTVELLQESLNQGV